MLNIRNGTFETNSSSSHSLIIKKDSLLTDMNIPEYSSEADIIEEFDHYYSKKDASFDFKYCDAYFGRYPFRVLSQPIDKFLYAWACDFTKDIPEDLFDFLKSYFPKVEKVIAPASLGSDEDWISYWKPKYNFTIKEFILNNRYVVICDGDEYCLFNRMNDIGLIDSNMIEDDN